MQRKTEIFVPKSLAMELKAKGYNEECVAYYKEIDNGFSKSPWIPSIYVINTMLIGDDVCTAPTYDQVVGWFASKGIDITPTGSSDMTEYSADIWNMRTKVFDCPWFANRQKALLTAFEEALKLI